MADNLKRLVIASGNAGKVREFRELLSKLPIETVGLDDFPATVEPEETGSTFAENAIIKATSYARQTGSWVLADDSGLEIAALDRAPGVYSARFGGKGSSFDEKMTTVLRLLDGIRDDQRAAWFACAIAVARPDARVALIAEGECAGRIATEPRGTGGFGYDPIFIPDGFSQTFSELPDDVKQEIGHRGRATAIIIRKILDFIEV